MDTEREKLYKVLTKVNWLSKYHVEIWELCSFLLFVCMCFDAVQIPYWAAWIEDLFTYNMGNVIAIIVVIWTFTVSLSTYCLDKLGKRYYGIPMSDVLLLDLKKKGIFALAGTVLTELFSLILAAILEWEITITMIAIQQFFIMIYLFLLVCVKTSYNHIIEQIEAEIEGYIDSDLTELMRQIKETKNDKGVVAKELMLFKMIQNLDYSNAYNREELLKILRGVANKLSEVLQRTEQFEAGQNQRKIIELQRDIIIFSTEMTLDIIDTAKTKKNIMDFLYSWMETENLMLEIKQGVVAALYEELNQQNVSICQNLIKVEQRYQRELQIWIAVYNVYIQEHIDEEWREPYTRQMFEGLHMNWKQKDTETALKYWGCLYELEGMYTPIFKYIF